MPNIKPIQPGQMPRAVEWNALAEDYNGGAIGRTGYASRRIPLSSGLVVVKNTSGSDRARFDCMKLDATTQTIDDDAEFSVIFEAKTADPAETPVILQEPIASNQFGIGRIFGYTLAKIEQASSATDLYGTPNATNHNLDASSAGPVKILAAPGTGADSLRPVLLGHSNETAIFCVTPGGGIAASSGTTISSATCTVWKRATSTVSAQSKTITVWNLSTSAVAGSVRILATLSNIGYVAVWEDC